MLIELFFQFLFLLLLPYFLLIKDSSLVSPSKKSFSMSEKSGFSVGISTISKFSSSISCFLALLFITSCSCCCSSCFSSSFPNIKFSVLSTIPAKSIVLEIVEHPFKEKLRKLI